MKKDYVLEKKEVGEISFAEYNPRQVSKNALDRLKKSLSSPQGKELFERRPILLNKRDGKLVVYAGNMRLRAAIALGMEIDPKYVDVIIERYSNYSKADKEEIYSSAVSVVQEEAEVGKG